MKARLKTARYGTVTATPARNRAQTARTHPRQQVPAIRVNHARPRPSQPVRIGMNRAQPSGPERTERQIREVVISCRSRPAVSRKAARGITAARREAGRVQNLRDHVGERDGGADLVIGRPAQQWLDGVQVAYRALAAITRPAGWSPSTSNCGTNRSSPTRWTAWRPRVHAAGSKVNPAPTRLMPANGR